PADRRRISAGAWRDRCRSPPSRPRRKGRARQDGPPRYRHTPACRRGVSEWPRPSASGPHSSSRQTAQLSAAPRLDAPRSTSPPPMQRADEREKAARRLEIGGDLPLEPLDQKPAAFVVQTAPAHVQRLDARGRRRLDRLVIALADQEIILDQLAERRERQHER